MHVLSYLNIISKKVVWLYHATPYFITKETPFKMVYDIDIMLQVEIETPTWRCEHFAEEGKAHP